MNPCNSKWPLLFVLTAFMNMATSQVIDSLKIIPAIPAPTDTVRLVAYTWFANSSCKATSWEWSQSLNEIRVRAVHPQGMLPAICNSTDTFPIAPFPAGSYVLIHEIYQPDSLNPDDSDTLFFSVTVSGVHSQTVPFARPEMLAWPNPVHDRLQLSFGQNFTAPIELRVYSAEGKKCQAGTYTAGETVVNIRHLPPGIYLVMATDANGHILRSIIEKY